VLFGLRAKDLNGLEYATATRQCRWFGNYRLYNREQLENRAIELFGSVGQALAEREKRIARASRSVERRREIIKFRQTKAQPMLVQIDSLIDSICDSLRADMAAKGITGWLRDEKEYKQAKFLKDRALRAFTKAGLNSLSIIEDVVITLGELSRATAQKCNGALKSAAGTGDETK
jgi:hypothetical protein